jgi:hypothetical protein
MSLVSSNCGERKKPARHAWLCLLLAALFLYNPFVVAPSSGAGLNLQESARHRATVGASELQQFRASERLAPVARMEALVGEILFVVKIVVFERCATPDVDVRTALNVLPASLWFRPPPSL